MVTKHHDRKQLEEEGADVLQFIPVTLESQGRNSRPELKQTPWKDTAYGLVNLLSYTSED